MVLEQKVDLWLSRIFDKRFRVINHILFWCIIYLDEFLSLFGITEPLEDNGSFLSSLAVDIFLVYCCLYLLVPRLLLKGKVLRFLLFALILIIVNVYLTNFVLNSFYDPEYDYFLSVFISGMVSTLTTVGSAIAIKMFKYYLKVNEERRKLDRAQMEAEIKSLEGQMNPHFLFNALNGIYINAKKRPAEVPEQIDVLSELLRYQLYDCKSEFVTLNKELNYLTNYIKLEKARRSDLNITYQIPENALNAQVAPFMLQPFVENAFKHGQAVEKESFIDINIQIADNVLLLTVLNSKADTVYKKITGGIGLENVKRRLDLIYSQKYTLDIEESKYTYSVKLKIELV